ncbi:hypothetical protein Klosneuvirus_4_65 [Klosneuvirus KNV1]|uniref:Uncharacterized protein n=1 Tax=Klosneuvirus KNV1 TaxID=1977640 RepID=A0A1V0SKJ9_9VIRU|nr:hypothetical protein Klosneuvirus_4_65 [Klosneuvirus KNV1]
MSNKQNSNNGPEIHIDMSGVKMRAGDQNMNIGWDGISVNGKKVEMSSSISSTICIDGKCKACINTECFDFECNDKAKIKENNVYCGDKIVISKKN